MDPGQIEPVRSRQGRYGKVKEAVRQVVLDAAPQALPTPEIAFRVADKLQIRFLFAADYRRWAKNAINRDLHRKWTEGLVERLQTPGQETHWRAAAGEQVTSLENLKAHARQLR